MNSRTKVRTKARRVPWALVAILIAALALAGAYMYDKQTSDGDLTDTAAPHAPK